MFNEKRGGVYEQVTRSIVVAKPEPSPVEDNIENDRWQKLQAQHPDDYTGSPVAPLPHCPEDDGADRFDIPQHQIDVFRAGGGRDELFEFLENLENAHKRGNVDT